MKSNNGPRHAPIFSEMPDRKCLARIVPIILLACSEAEIDRGPQSAPSQDAPVEPRQLSGEEIAAVVAPSVVLLEMEDVRGQPTALGSGFVVGNNYVVTNFHVVRGAAAGTARPVGALTAEPIRGTRFIDRRRDLVLLEVQFSLPALKLNLDLPPLGQDVFAVGNPHGLEGTLSQGIISGRRAFAGDSVLQLTAPISPGSSGGPVVNRRAEVIGVATASLRDGQNLNFAVPSRYVRFMLDSAKGLTPLTVPSPPGESLFDDVGDVPTKGVTGTDFLWDRAILLDMVFPYHGAFTFSIRNTLSQPIEDVTYALIFRNAAGEAFLSCVCASLQGGLW